MGSQRMLYVVRNGYWHWQDKNRYRRNGIFDAKVSKTHYRHYYSTEHIVGTMGYSNKGVTHHG